MQGKMEFSETKQIGFRTEWVSELTKPFHFFYFRFHSESPESIWNAKHANRKKWMRLQFKLSWSLTGKNWTLRREKKNIFWNGNVPCTIHHYCVGLMDLFHFHLSSFFQEKGAYFIFQSLCNGESIAWHYNMSLQREIDGVISGMTRLMLMLLLCRL